MVAKHLLVALVFVLSCSCSYLMGKNHSVDDSISQEEAVLLNNIVKRGLECESDFRTVVQVRNRNYDFSGKKVAFYTGPGAGARTNKEHFLSVFEKCCQEESDEQSTPTSIVFYFFDNEEKDRADGYDAVVVYGSVKQYPSKKALIRRLHKIRFFGSH